MIWDQQYHQIAKREEQLKNKFQQITQSISWHSQKPCRRIKRQTSESTIQLKSLFKCHTGACGIKGKKKKCMFYLQIICTHHQQCLMSTSEENTHHDVFTQNTKNIFKNNKNGIFHCHFIRLLLAQCARCHRLSPAGLRLHSNLVSLNECDNPLI